MPERLAHAERVLVGGEDQRIKGEHAGRGRAECAGADGSLQRHHAARVVDDQIQIELEVPARVQAFGVHDAQPKAVEEKGPAGAAPPGFGDGEAPERIERLAPGSDDQRDRPAVRSERCRERWPGGLGSRRRLEAESGKERYGARLQLRAWRRRRPDGRGRSAPLDQVPLQPFDRLVAALQRQATLEERDRQQPAVNSWQHGYGKTTSTS